MVIIRNIRHLAKVWVVTSLCVTAIGCTPSRATSQASPTSIINPELALTEQQIKYIKSNAPKLLARRGFTEEIRQPYSENLGTPVPVILVATRGAVAVFIPKLRHIAVSYIRMPDGRLDYPAINSWPEMFGKDDVEGDIKHFPDAGPFQILISSTDGDELGLTERQKEAYYELEFITPRRVKRPIRYWKAREEITLLSENPPYEPISEDKAILLKRITDCVEENASPLFDDGMRLTITVPNFDIGDTGVAVLIEPTIGESCVLNIRLTSNPKRQPVMYTGVSICAARYGIEDDRPQWIKRNALRKYKLTVMNGLYRR